MATNTNTLEAPVGVSDVISSAMTIIDDIRLTQMLKDNTALFYRKMCQYADLAIPMMSQPPELFKTIMDGYTASTFSDSSWTSTAASVSAETVVETGVVGADLCTITILDDSGMPSGTYEDATYDSVTGNVTFPKQEKEGIEYELDFYTDGIFEVLTPSMRRLMALAIAIVWDERLNHNWLNIQPKIKDSSFDTVNEANYMEKLTTRMKENRIAFNEELRKYEQNNTYIQAVPELRKMKKLI